VRRSLRSRSGSRLVRNTSALATSLSRISLPSSEAMLRPRLRLLRLGCSMAKLTPPAPLAPTVPMDRPRCGSPVSGCSILMTSAPQSARTPAPGGHECPAGYLYDLHTIQDSGHVVTLLLPADSFQGSLNIKWIKR